MKLRWLLELIFPRFCAGCNRFGTWWCSHCHNQLSFFPGPIRLELPELALDEIRAAVRYQPPAVSLITQLKYASVRELSLIIARIMWLSLPPPPPDSVVTSVPLHRRRQRERGFNQAVEIGRELARLWQLPYLELLTRTRNTSAQAKQTHRSNRLTHLQSAFKLRRPPPSNSVVIVDDVITTGSTLNLCGQVLRQAGVTTVVAVGFCHRSA